MPHRENLGWRWPTEGRFDQLYSYWMLICCLYIQLFIIARSAFEDTPNRLVVFIELFLEIVFAVDMFRCFTLPYWKDNRWVRNRKSIANRYLKSWFLYDLYCFYPLANFRYMIVWDEGYHNESGMSFCPNFERMPRLYSFMLIFQLGRARDTWKLMKRALNDVKMSNLHQNLAIRFITLLYTLHLIGCIWFVSS
jgi:hypothetical protein